MFPVPECTFLQDSLQTACPLGLSNWGDLSQGFPPRAPSCPRFLKPLLSTGKPEPSEGCTVQVRWRRSARVCMRTAAVRGDSAPEPQSCLIGSCLSVCRLLMSLTLSSPRLRQLTVALMSLPVE